MDQRPPGDGPRDEHLQEVVVHPDGRVAFKHLSTELLPVARALAPDDERLRHRQRLAGGDA
jgi:hypothetical protein